MRNIFGVMSVGVAVFLAGCGSSSDVDGTTTVPGSSGNVPAVSRQAVPLGSKTDALRELRVSGLVASQIAGGNIGLNLGPNRPQPLAWAFGHSERGATGTTNGQYSFQFFTGGQPAVGRAQTNYNNQVSQWNAGNGVTEKLTLNGVSERGQSADRVASYESQGSGENYYAEIRERRGGGGLLASESLRLRGTSEVRWPEGGELDARGLLNYRFETHDGAFFRADIGESGNPFKVLQGEALSYDGVYAYEQSGASGAATAATLTPIVLDAEGSPVAGSLKITSGNDTATFTFRTDGSASLQLNTASQELSATEVRNALRGTQS